jgi:hypothetical protein
MRSSWRPIILGAAVLASLALAACGDSNASSPTSANAAPAAGQAVTLLGELKSMNGATLNVGRDKVEVTNSTLVFRNNLPIKASELRIGETVRVKGWYNDNATAVVARQVIVEVEG